MGNDGVEDQRRHTVITSESVNNNLQISHR